MSHATLPRSVRSDGTGRVIRAALFAPLLLLVVVAGMTWRSERRVAAVTDRVVHDYAAIAVWQYARRANTALHDEVMRAFSGSPSPAHQRGAAAMAIEPPSALLSNSGASTSSFRRGARFAFNYDPSTGRLDLAGDTIGSRTLAMLQHRLRAATRATRMGDEPHRVLFDTADGHRHAIALWLVPRGENSSPLARGIASDQGVLDDVFARVVREPGLLPAVAGADGVRTGDLAVTVTQADGAVVFTTGHPFGPTAATDTTGLQEAELRVMLDLPPALARELLIGAAPGSQLPALGLMILAAGVLAIIGLVHQSRSRALAQARTRFVANVSHELRTPLAQLSMFAETLHLGRERTEAERREFAGIVFAEARRMTALVENVLRFSRSEHSAPVLQLRGHDIGDLIANAVTAFAPLASAADVQIEVDVPEGMHVRVDAAAFQQVVLNLLDNAVKHGGSGRVRVSAGITGDDVRVLVDDAGPGVPAEWRDRVFEPFAQVDGRNIAGAGIGLAIVRDLTVAHGGRVWIESSPSGGARAVVALPRDASAAPAEPDVRPVLA